MITKIVAHGSPVHLDELIALVLLRRYGEEKLPGISKAAFRTLVAEDNLEALLQDPSIVLLGCGNGAFDEHVFNGDKSKKDECTATLVAKFLNVHEDAKWRKIFKYVLHTDRNPSTLALDLASTVMRFQRQGMGLNSVLHYVEITVDAALKEQDEFFQADWNKIREEELVLHGERSLMAVIEGNDRTLVRQARFFGAAVVVVRNPDGHVQILTTNHLDLDMRDTLRTLRVLELKTQRAAIPEWKKLEQEGTIEEVPEWFFHAEANNILNGSDSRPDVPATKLSLQVIIEAVRTGLERNRFEPKRQEQCLQGVCSASPRNPCPWYDLGLSRCRAIRARMHQNG